MFRTKTLAVACAAAAVLIFAAASTVLAQGAHLVAASMNNKRALHTMTALPDGRVIAIGGEDPFLSYEPLATAEIYDPATNTWTLTGSLVKGRSNHTATLLADGRVLVTGGKDPEFAAHPRFRILKSAEIYDPATAVFTAIGDMNMNRQDHRATLLSDGRVLVSGGVTATGLTGGAGGVTRTATAEIYDPATNTFTAVASMSVVREWQGSTLLADGRVLITAGSFTTPQTAEIFDPTTSTFSTVAAPMSIARTGGAILLDDGRVFAAAGGNADIFNPATESFTSFAMPSGFGYWSVIEKLDDGRVYLGHDGKAFLFDPFTETFSAVMTNGLGRLFPAGARLPGDRVLSTGGQDFVPFTFVSRDYARIFVPNDPPIADAGANQSVSPGPGCIAEVTLDASASSDPDGDVLTYEWTQNGSVVGSSETLTLSLGIGTHELTLTVSDGNGETDTATVSIAVSDTTPPSFVLPAPVILEQAGPAGTFHNFVIPTATDNCDANPVVTATGVPADSIFPAGATSVTVSASDAANNLATGTTTVTVRDTIAPALTLPADITVIATHAGGAEVTFDVAASDAVTAAPVVGCAPVSGSVFAIGTTPVSCSSTDSAGNTSTGGFTVTVMTQNPVAADDVAETTEPTAVIIPVLANDVDHDGGTLSVVLGTGPGHGQAVVNGDGTVTYTPMNEFTGTDTFTYRAADNQGGISTPATVTITVNPRSTLPRYVVMSVEHTWLKADIDVLSGDIGTNTSGVDPAGPGKSDDDGGAHPAAELVIGTRVTMHDPVSRVVGDSVWLHGNSSVYNVEANELFDRQAAILGTTTGAVSVPVVSLPALPAITPTPGQKTTVRRNTTVMLAAGSYGQVKVERGAVLLLTGGTYHMASLEIDQQARVVYRAATELRIAGTLRTDVRAGVIPDAAASGVDASEMVILVAGESVRIGPQSLLHANIYAPDGTLWLDSGTQATGAFVGRRVIVGPHVRLSLDSAF